MLLRLCLHAPPLRTVHVLSKSECRDHDSGDVRKTPQGKLPSVLLAPRAQHKKRTCGKQSQRLTLDEQACSDDAAQSDADVSEDADLADGGCVEALTQGLLGVAGMSENDAPGGGSSARACDSERAPDVELPPAYGVNAPRDVRKRTRKVLEDCVTGAAMDAI